MPQFYRPGGSNVPPFDTLADPRRFSILVDDFVGGSTETGEVGQLGFNIKQIAGDSGPDVDVITTASVVLGRPGVVQLNTGATTPAAADEGALYLQGAVALDASTQPVYLAAGVRFPSVASVEFNFGLFATAVNAGRDSDSVTIELDTSASTKLTGVSVASNTASSVDLGVTAAANTWYTLEIIATSSWVGFYVDGDFLGELTSNIPTAALVPGFKVATEANAEKSVQIDFFCQRMPVSRT